MSNDHDDRAIRRAEQLRANLRKRKQQARGKPEGTPAARGVIEGEPEAPADN